jgi:hypothetical protein
MERNNIFYQCTSSLSEPLPQNYRRSEVARYHQKQRTMEKDKTANNQLNNKIMTMEVDKAHRERQITTLQNRMELPRKEKER